MSLYNDTILVGHTLSTNLEDSLLTLISYNGSCISRFTPYPRRRNTIVDATWTFHGKILYILQQSGTGKTVMLLTSASSDNILVKNVMSNISTFCRFFVSYDGIIYFADDEKRGVYRSIDEGNSWSLIFNSTTGWHCLQVIVHDNSHFWTLERSSNYSYSLHIYNTNEHINGNNLKFKTVNTTTPEGKSIQLSQFSSMAYDNNEQIFLSDHGNVAIHVFLVSGRYHCQLLSSENLQSNPYKLTLDIVRQNLYVGYVRSKVSVFELK